MTTENQIKANRENAQKSTGPLDTSKTRFNAVKHGLFCKKLSTEEEKEEFNLIFQELIQEYNPKGATELRVLEMMASSLKDLEKVHNIESKHAFTYNFGPPNIDENFLRYKKELENRFSKALKMIKESKKD